MFLITIQRLNISALTWTWPTGLGLGMATTLQHLVHNTATKQSTSLTPTEIKQLSEARSFVKHGLGLYLGSLTCADHVVSTTHRDVSSSSSLETHEHQWRN